MRVICRYQLLFFCFVFLFFFQQETEDPSNSIQFQCWQPLRLHGKSSSSVKADVDLKCDDSEERFVDTSEYFLI